MQDWILLLTLSVAALSSAAVWIICRCCLRMRRDKDLRIVQAVREQDTLARELEHTRIEKQTLEGLITTELNEAATQGADRPAGPDPAATETR